MITFDRVTVTYPGASAPALDNVNLAIEEGHLALVIGSTGSGKSTLLRCVNGLVPHFSGGRLNGSVTVDGRSTEQYRPRDLADAVGYVGQDPDASFVADTVEDELAYAMENLGVDPATMRRRVEDVLDTLNLHSLRQRAITTLSGGQRRPRRHRRCVHRGTSRSRARRTDVITGPRLGRGGARVPGAPRPRPGHHDPRRRAPPRTHRAVRRHRRRTRRGSRCGAQRHARGDIRHFRAGTTCRPPGPCRGMGAGPALGPRRSPSHAESSAAASRQAHGRQRGRRRATSSRG